VKNILVVQAEQLLGAAIVSLLYGEYDLNVMGCMADTAAELIEKINHLHPDVVIIEQAHHFTEAIHLLSPQHWFKSRLMMVSNDHNWVQLDDKEQILLTKRADLANIIRYDQE
jgi:DNA-binding NarL/FixJ family response regulator